jgi:hypothetical protein
MTDVPREDLLSVVACDIDARPQAPTVTDLAPLILGYTRSDGALNVRFPADALATVEAFAAAERQCCADIGWEVASGREVTLTVTTNAAALDVIESMFAHPV